MSDAQCALLRPVVAGRVVHDLGAGDLGMAHLLVHLGASRVVAIDKCESPAVRALKKGGPIEFHRSFHDEYLKDHWEVPVDVAFMSWPYNMLDLGLLLLAARAKTIVYLGINVGGGACGFPDLFHHFLTRKLEHHCPNARNTLLILGGELDSPREPVYEERGGLESEMLPNLA